METLFYAGLSNALTATFLALLVVCLGRFLGRRPAVLHCLWLLVLVKLVTPPLYEVPVPWPETFRGAAKAAEAESVVSAEIAENPEFLLTTLETAVGEADDAEAGDGASVLELVRVPEDHAAVRPIRAAGAWFSADWVRPLALIWLVGTVSTLAIAIVRIRRFQRVLRNVRPADLETQEWVHDLSLDLGLNRPPSVWWIEGRLSPLVWALDLRPRVIIPIDLWKSLDDRQRTTLIVHELAHLRRGDHYLRIFELLVTALFWWHPVLWWVRQALRDAEEQCCDAWVVWAFPDAAKAYAETLLETLDFLNQSPCAEPLLASGFGKVHHLRKRLTMIMSGTTPRLLGLWGALGSLSLAALLLPINATWAQQVEEKREVRVQIDPAVSTSTLAVITADDPEVVLKEIVTTADPSKQEVFNFEIVTDDVSTKVSSDSLDDALAQIKHCLAT